MNADEARKLANSAIQSRSIENEKIVKRAIERINAEIQESAELGELSLTANFTGYDIFEDFPEYTKTIKRIEAHFIELGFKTKIVRFGRALFVSW